MCVVGFGLGSEWVFRAKAEGNRKMVSGNPNGFNRIVGRMTVFYTRMNSRERLIALRESSEIEKSGGTPWVPPLG